MIDEPCDECGFNYRSVKPSDLPELLGELGRHFGEQLHGHSCDELRSKPGPDVWSPLEYSCHVRDVEQSAWARTLIYNWPAPHQLDVTGLAAHTAHEAVDHLGDMRQPL